MNINDISEAPVEGPTRFGLHTLEGFGKTTLAAFFPAPVFLASENGFPRDLPFRPKRFPHPETWGDVRSATMSLINDKHDRETFVVDTVDHIEPLLHRYLCQRDSGRQSEMNKKGSELISIEDYGYGKGYIAAEEEFRSWVSDLDILQRKRAMHVVLLMHSHVKKFQNPSGADFDRYEPKMHSRISRVVVEWCENFFFGYFEVAAGKLGDEKKAKGVSTGRRMLGTRTNALYDAKNRMNLPAEIPLEQPEALIPYLLGEHLIGQAPPTQRSVAPRVATPSHPTKAEPRKSNGKSASKPEPKPDITADVSPQEMLNTPDPKPSKTVEAKSEPATSDAPMTDIEKKLVNARERVIQAGIVASNGKPYEEAIDAWIAKANGDDAKLSKILSRVESELAAINQAQA